MAAGNNAEDLYNSLNKIKNLEGDVLVDDRSNMTIGKRQMQAKRFGYPFIVVLGKRILENPPLYEVHDIDSGIQLDLTSQDLIQYIINCINENK